MKSSPPAAQFARDEEPAVSNPLQRAFLAAYRETGIIRLACAAARVGRSSHYRWLDEDPAYREAYERAKDDAADTLEAEVTRRAVEGVEEPVGWYKGKAGGTVRRYSDVLLMFRLKALRPEQYRERVEVNGGLLARIDFSKLPDEIIHRITSGENIIAVLASSPGLAGLLKAAEGEQQIGSGTLPERPHEPIAET